MDIGDGMGNHPYRTQWGGGKNFKKAVAEVTTVEIFCLCLHIYRWMYTNIFNKLVGFVPHIGVYG